MPSARCWKASRTNRGAKRSSISALIDRLATEPVAELVAREIESRNLPLVGGRSLEEIAARLADKSADRSEAALDQAKADAITSYLNIVERADNLEGHLNRTDPGRNFNEARKYFQSALPKWKSLASTPSASNSRRPSAANSNITPALSSRLRLKQPDGFVAVAGGGRYDNLLSDMGSPMPCPPWAAPSTPSA